MVSKLKNDGSSGGGKLISFEDDGYFIEGEEVSSLILNKFF